MALYHFSAKIRMRGSSTSGSTPLHAQYILREGKYEKNNWELESCASGNMPSWAEEDPVEYWKQLDLYERANGRACRSIILALPDELTSEQNEKLLTRYIEELTGELALPYTWAIHNAGDGNPHAHIMINERCNDGVERPPELWFKRAHSVDPAQGGARKTQKLKGRQWLCEARALWAQHQNIALEEAGWSARVDHRSYIDRGLDIAPGIHRGVKGRAFDTEYASDIQKLQRRNGDVFLGNPEECVRAMAQSQPAFTADEFERFLQARMDNGRVAGVFARAKESGALVELRHRHEGKVLYSSEEQIFLEARLGRMAEKLAERGHHRVSMDHARAPSQSRGMGFQQELAYRHLVQESGDVAVVQGYAGAGKSYMLGAAREAWEAQGFEVVGAALAGKAAASLENEAGIQSRTLASWEYRWAKGMETLSRKHVIVIDEAGMVGTDQLLRLMQLAENAGAKIALVGDTEQLQAITSGAGMKLVADKVGQAVISEVRRQKVEWQRQATVDMGAGNMNLGLGAYAARGHFKEYQSDAVAVEKMVDAWANTEAPASEKLMLAFRNDQVRALNLAARAQQKAEGYLLGGVQVETEKGEREFAAGDRLVFLKNDSRMNVMNGSLGSVASVSEKEMKVHIDGDMPREVVVDLRAYKHFDHSYAVTIHKSQGATVDHVQVLASRAMDSHASYVALSRHRKSVSMHWSQESYQNQDELVAGLSVDRGKRNVGDFQNIDHESMSGWRALVRRHLGGGAGYAEARADRFNAWWEMDTEALLTEARRYQESASKSLLKLGASSSLSVDEDIELKNAHYRLEELDQEIQESSSGYRKMRLGQERDKVFFRRERCLELRRKRQRKVPMERKEAERVSRVNSLIKDARSSLGEIQSILQDRKLSEYESQYQVVLQGLLRGERGAFEIERTIRAQVNDEGRAWCLRHGLSKTNPPPLPSPDISLSVGDAKIRLDVARRHLNEAALAWEQCKAGSRYDITDEARRGVGPMKEIYAQLTEAQRQHREGIRALVIAQRLERGRDIQSKLGTLELRHLASLKAWSNAIKKSVSPNKMKEFQSKESALRQEVQHAREALVVKAKLRAANEAKVPKNADIKTAEAEARSALLKAGLRWAQVKRDSPELVELARVSERSRNMTEAQALAVQKYQAYRRAFEGYEAIMSKIELNAKEDLTPKPKGPGGMPM